MDYDELLVLAGSKLQAADHLFSTTYKLIQEPKLLVAIIEHLFESIDLSVQAAIVYERQFSKFTIPDFFEGKIDLFKEKVSAKYGMGANYVDYARLLFTIVNEHKKSAVEFKRKEQYVISDNDFKLHVLHPNDVMQHIKKTRLFIDQIKQLCEGPHG